MRLRLAVSTLRIAVTGVILLGVPRLALAGWSAEDIESGTSWNCAMALDGQGRTHVAYAANGVLTYAVQSRGRWVKQVVTPMVGHRLSLAIDASGHAHIAHEEARDLRYTTNASGAWTTTIIEEAAPLGGGELSAAPSIAIGPGSIPHVAFINGTLVKYATLVQGAWTTTPAGIVHHFANVPRDVSLSIDASGSAHVTFFDASTSTSTATLYYATNAPNGTAWVMSATSGRSAGVNFPLSSALDSQGHVHMAFVDADYHVTYMTNRSGWWVSERIDANDPVAGGSLSLAVDQNDRVHVAHGMYWGQFLKYRTNASGAWVAASLEAGGVNSASLRLFSSEVHITYVTQSDRVRHLAKRLRFEDDESALHYTGDWKWLECKWCSDGTARTQAGTLGRLIYPVSQTLRAPSRLTFEFIGSEVRWIAYRGPDLGKAKVFIDGVPVATVDLYSSRASPQQAVFRRKCPSSGTHTLRIDVLSAKNTASTGYTVPVDAIDVLP